MKRSQTGRESLSHFQQNIDRLQENYSTLKNYDLKKLYLLGLSFFVFELTPKKENSSGMSLVTEVKEIKNSSVVSRESAHL